MASIRIHLPAALSERVSGIRTLTVSATSVSGALVALADGHPELGRLLFREPGVLRPHVHVFVENGGGATNGDGALGDGDELRIVPSIAGG